MCSPNKNSDIFDEECINESQETDAKEQADLFSLEFAASQWQRLVRNAENLLVSLCKQGIPIEAREQIEQWLFLKQECDGCFANDGSVANERETFSLDRIDEVTESESKTSIEKSDTETEYSDSGAEIDDAADSAKVERKKQDFALKLDTVIGIFREKHYNKVSKCVGSIRSEPLPRENLPTLTSTCNVLKNQRRRSVLPSSLTDCRLPVTDSAKNQSSLTQSRKKLKQFLRQLRKDEEHSTTEEENKLCVYEEPNNHKEVKTLVQLTEMTNMSESDEHQNLRDEITNLRITRDFLVEQRKILDVRLNKDTYYTVSQQRRFLELDEAIEAIDNTIEFKNGSICGQKSFEGREREEGDQMLLDRLMKLSEIEMRLLLFKYFQKTVDLREWGRKLEQEISELDHKIEAQTWKIQTLSIALQQANAENERRLVTVHREHEEKLHLMFRHYTGTGTGSSSSADTRTTDEHRALQLPSLPIASIPLHNLRKLRGSTSGHTTKVTRKKNKLIIHQQHK